MLAFSFFFKVCFFFGWKKKNFESKQNKKKGFDLPKRNYEQIAAILSDSEQDDAILSKMRRLKKYI